MCILLMPQIQKKLPKFSARNVALQDTLRESSTQYFSQLINIGHFVLWQISSVQAKDTHVT